ncbi:big signal peptidase [Plasmodium gonderi]|uniref:Big signal peptidase n=1 Tax=Plasmodium gonderi TaxID=77519 RepID=A0A1Y1JLQ0_PLAGO|nr:big signal peptidase [Plasmodium gonderi]GAW83409.1 big signal peptidase [Plasmodium gonderi]
MNRSRQYGKRLYALKFIENFFFYTNKFNYNSSSYYGRSKGEYVLLHSYAKLWEEKKKLQCIICRNANICNHLLSQRNKTTLLRGYSEKKKRSNNRSKVKKRKKHIFNFVKINNPINFIKKLILSFLLISGINNYILDMTLTSGSSMCPLINKNGVILFYVCDDTIRFFHQVRNILLYSFINILFHFNAITESNFNHSSIEFLNNSIFRITEKLKKKMAENKHFYRRGDVILLTSPVNDKKRVCKRIIAIENDKLFVDSMKSFVYIPKDNIWVEGDNKMDSFDSRNYGFVHKDLIVGRVFFLLDPFSNFRFINNKTSCQNDSKRIFLS